MKKVLDYVKIVLIAIDTVFAATFGFILLPFLGQKKALKIASSIWSYLILKISGVTLVIEGSPPRDNKARIYVCNHESNMDIPCLFLAIPEAVFFIAKKELQKIPFMGWYMTAVGMIFIDRRDRSKSMESMKKAGQEIKKGKSVLSFPEGTRSKTGEMGIFKRGSFILGVENDIEIIPISLEGTGKIIPTGKFEINGGKVIVNFGTPLDSKTWKGKVDLYAQYTRDVVKALKSGESMA